MTSVLIYKIDSNLHLGFRFEGRNFRMCGLGFK